MSFRNKLALIFATAVLIRAGAALALWSVYGPAGLLIDDSLQYLTAAGGDSPQHGLMPLYLMFLSWHQTLFGVSPLWPVLSQVAIDSATCVIIALIAATFDQRLSLPAGLFAALNPVQIVTATLVLTEPLFVFFVAASLLGCIRWLRRPHGRWAALAGLGVGFGLLTRAMLAPWLLVLPLILILTAAIMWRTSRRVLGHAVAFGLLLPAALQAPVLLNNHATFGAWGLTSQGGVHALKWVVPLVMEARDGTSQEDGARQMDVRFADVIDPAKHPNPFEQSRAMGRAAFEVLLELGPAAIMKAWVYGAAINLFSPAVILTTPVRELPRTGFFATPGDSKFDKIVNFLFRNDNSIYGWVLLFAAFGTLICRGFQLRGAWRWLRSGVAGNRLMLASGVLCVLWIGFILAINGPIAAAKYRAPIEPVFAILFAIGWARRQQVLRDFTPPSGRL